jgi:hypothetical protein
MRDGVRRPPDVEQPKRPAKGRHYESRADRFPPRRCQRPAPLAAGAVRPAAARSAPQRVAAVLAGMAMVLLTGCASMGPPTIARDRFDYVTTISESWKRQMLLNLLKVRYADAPVFMDVASVISSYSLEGDISLSGQYASPGRGDTFGQVGAAGRYTDRPTITYQPLIGDKFAKSMMAPIPVSGILFLIQAVTRPISCCGSA